MFWQQLLNGLVIGGVYALIALGLTMVYGVLRILHIAHAAVYVLGAYVGLFAFLRLQNLLAAILLAMVVSSLVGVLIYRFVYRPMLSAPRIVPLIASIGLFMAFEDLYRLLFGPYVKSFQAPGAVSPLRLGTVVVTREQLLILAVTAVLLAIVWMVVARTRIGLGWKAVAQDLETALAMGVNANRVVAFNFLFGSALAATAGVLVGILYNSVYPAMGSMPAYKMLAVVVLGGLGSVPGTVVAALVLGLTETFMVGYVGFILPRDAIAFVALILILLVRPQGLLGKAGAR